MTNKFSIFLFWFVIAIFIVCINGHCADIDHNKEIPCSEIVDRLYSCNSDFIEKSLEKQAEPFALCTSIETFRELRLLKIYYNALLTKHELKMQNVTCADEYINKNRMNLVNTIITNSINIWGAANCDECYQDTTSTVQNFSQNTQKFYSHFNNYLKCVNETKPNVENKNSTICTFCEQYYTNLNKLFENVKRAQNNKICFDLEDIMNKTRREWSGIYNCSRDKRDSLTAFFSLVSAVFLVTISFYGTAYFVGIRQSPTETLDERDLPVNTPSTSSQSSAAPPVSSSTNVPVPKKLNINDDGSDDELLIGLTNNQNTNSNLIRLDN